MSGLKLSRLILHEGFATGLLAIFAMASPSLALGEEEVIKIHFARPWRVGEETIKMMPSISAKWGKYTFLAMGKEPMNSIIKPGKDKIDVAILTQNQWFMSLNQGHFFPLLQNWVLTLLLLTKMFFRTKRLALLNFLETWQSAWLKTDYPYGVQPPEIAFLRKNTAIF